MLVNGVCFYVIYFYKFRIFLQDELNFESEKNIRGKNMCIGDFSKKLFSSLSYRRFKEFVTALDNL